ncbi:MAG: DMT family transporter [Oxalobacteraceae bacterium]
MSPARLISLTLIAMIAFAANSLLCRFALRTTPIDAASFATIRLLSGALMLWLIVVLRSGAGKQSKTGGNWRSALALFIYAAAFSFAYAGLSTGTGALLLFGAVQATMLAAGWLDGERLSLRQGGGFVLALGGLVAIMLPGLSAPPLGAALLMLLAGFSWGVYSLCGRGVPDAVAATAGNFMRAAWLALALSLSVALLSELRLDGAGVLYAVLSGAIASGLGYVVWFAAIRGLSTTTAATVQLSVPVIAAAGGIVFLQEPVTLRLLLSSLAILGGIALVVLNKRQVI